MDTWSLGCLWLRNTSLIQLLVLSWTLVAFTIVYLLRATYWTIAKDVLNSPNGWIRSGTWCGVLCGISVTWIVSKSLTASKRKVSLRLKRLLIAGVIAAWVGAALCSTLLVRIILGWPTQGSSIFSSFQPSTLTDYSRVLAIGGVTWAPVLVATFLGLAVVTWFSLQTTARDRKISQVPESFWDTWPWRCVLSVFVPLLCTLMIHLCLAAYVCADLHLAMAYPRWVHARPVAEFVLGPTAILMSYAVGILLLLGLIAKRSNEQQREWWTRYGAWILVVGITGLALSTVVMVSPWLLHTVSGSALGLKIKWGAVLVWVAGTVSGLLTGKSSKTSENGASKSPSMEWIARLGGLLFLAGGSVLASWLLWTFFYAIAGQNHGPVDTIAGTDRCWILITLTALVTIGLVFSYCFDINIFGLNQLYRNRLVRCYLGATRWQTGMRRPDWFTNFDFDDELNLHDLASGAASTQKFGGDEFRGPFPVFNCALNLAGSQDLTFQTRHSASFMLTPLFCGSSLASVGYVPTKDFNKGIRLGHAIAVSGAAASPNMGYNTSPLVALLLSLFNIRLGWWIPNPGRKKWNQRGLRFSAPYMLFDLIGEANERRNFLNVSDGGHFENMGIYEMVRRRCKVIIVGDGECDELMQFGGLANAIRLCATDFGASIDIDVSSVKPQPATNSMRHAAVGTIRYADGSIGRLIYLKASMTGDEDTTVLQYKASHPSFPHQATANQFFTEDQFESYRRLGRHVVQQTFREAILREEPVAIAERLADTLVSGGGSEDRFLNQTKQLDKLWERLRGLSTENSKCFIQELMGHTSSEIDLIDQDITAIGLELLQFMENVFIDLRLDDFWEHPDNRGWAMLFMSWARSRRLRSVWRDNHQTFGIRFEYFCDRRLGLWVEKPVSRASA